MQPRALGSKVSDEFVTPLCRIHHRAVHRVRDERAWWKQTGIDAVQVARKLWRNSRRNETSPRTKSDPGIDAAPNSSNTGAKVVGKGG
jgi:hypothetical protein